MNEGPPPQGGELDERVRHAIHEFNNQLLVIANYAQFVADQVADDAAALRDVQQIQRAAERCAELITDLRSKPTT